MGLCITLVVISLLVGTQLSNYLGQARMSTTTVEFTPTEVSTYATTFTVDLFSTTTTTYIAFSRVDIIGQISSVDYGPAAIQFESYTCLATPQSSLGCVFSANLTFAGGTVATNGTNYDVTLFSVAVPNNQNYSMIVVFRNNSTTSAGFFPLFNNTNGTAYLFIQCTLPGSNSSSSPNVCQIN